MRFLSVLLLVPAVLMASGSSELPQALGPIWGDMDTGNCKMTITAHGGIGFTAPDSAGSGFHFPKVSAQWLYYCGMLCGNSPTYIADRFYGNPAPNLNKDFRIVDSLHRDNLYGGQEYSAVMNDSNHPTPQGLIVRLHTIALPAPYGNGCIIIYDYWNNGANALNGMYAGLWADFDMGTSSTTNLAMTDPARRLAMMRQSTPENPVAGLAVLYPHQASNLSVVDHDVYVYPTDSCVTEDQKYRWLNGALHADSSNRPYDWSINVATGPFDLAPGATQRTAFTMIAGASRAELNMKLDSLQSWLDANLGIAGNSPVPAPSLLTVSPNPVSGLARITLGAPLKGDAHLGLYDRSGRLVTRLWQGRLNGHTLNVNWNSRALNSGIYFLRFEGAGLLQTLKTVVSN